jgi:hypothetical protein
MKPPDNGCGTPAWDNPAFLARTIGDWMANWQGPKGETGPICHCEPLKFSPGEYAFKQHCAACHNDSKATRIGPDLRRGHQDTRPRVARAIHLRRPTRMLADGDPIAKELFEKYRERAHAQPRSVARRRGEHRDLSRQEDAELRRFLHRHRNLRRRLP